MTTFEFLTISSMNLVSRRSASHCSHDLSRDESRCTGRAGRLKQLGVLVVPLVVPTDGHDQVAADGAESACDGLAREA